MKVWMFYYKADKADIIHDYSPDDVESKYPLYAITNDKKLAHAFMNDRNMNSFSVKVNKTDFDDYKKFVKDHQDLVLKYYTLSTKDDREKIIHTDLVCTNYEYLAVTDYDLEFTGIIDDTFWDAVPIYNLFNKKAIKYLRILGFTGFYKMAVAHPIIPENEDDYSDPGVEIDELSLLLSLFKGTFI